MSDKVENLMELLIKYEPKRLVIDEEDFELFFEDIDPIEFGQYEKDDILIALAKLYGINAFYI